MILSFRAKALCLLAVSLALASCTPSCSCSCATDAPKDDAGDYSFVRQAVPLLLGRKIRGYEETRLLADVVHAVGGSRDVLVRSLMESPEYVAHWSEHFADELRVNRFGQKNQTACFAASVQADPSPDLATFLRDNRADAGAGPATDFNMADVLVSSLKADNLFPIYSSYLFAMENKPLQGNMATEKNMRDDMAATFTYVYTHRKVSCLQCHRTDFSRTGPQTYWDRHHPIPANFEKAIFHDETDSSVNGEDIAHAQFRTDANGGSSIPWTRMTGCGSFNPAPGADPMAVSPYFTESKNPMTIMDTHIYLHEGRRSLAMHGLQRGYPAGCAQCDQPPCTNQPPREDPGVEAVFSNNRCFTCHAGGSGGLTMSPGNWAANLIGVQRSAGGMLRVAVGDPDHSFLMKKLTGDLPNQPTDGSQMPAGGPYLNGADIATVRNWIQNLPPTGPVPPGCSICSDPSCGGWPMEVNGRQAFAFLVAANVVDQTWREIMGYPLTIANYFPRNAEQELLLWQLTEFQFIPSDWSLRSLLARILTSEYFNRKAPAFGTTGTPYDMPKFFDPWTEADPRQPPIALPGWTPGNPPTPDPAYHPENHPENHKNAMSEHLHRYSPRSLLYSASTALGWPGPNRFFTSPSYPTSDLAKAIGQFWRDGEPGFRDVDFQGLIQWESVQGACQNQNGGGQDWISLLLAAINTYNQAHAGAELTREQVIAVLKDWLISDGQISTTVPAGATQHERAALEAFFGGPLTDRTNVSDPMQRADLESKLRRYCGALLETPQFMLAGIAPTDLGPAPALRVCNDANHCTYSQMCQDLQPWVASHGWNLDCSSDPVSATRIVPARYPMPLANLCQFIPCRIMPDMGFDECVRQKFPMEACLPQRPPSCDPRCSRIDCCGGPLPQELDAQSPGYLLAWAEGGKVVSAEGVRIRRAFGHATAQSFEPLSAGAPLKAGDVLEIAPHGKLRLDAGKGAFKTPEGGMPEHGKYGNWYLMITGESLLRKAAHPPIRWELTPEEAALAKERAEADRKYRYPLKLRPRNDPKLRLSAKAKANPPTSSR